MKTFRGGIPGLGQRAKIRFLVGEVRCEKKETDIDQGESTALWRSTSGSRASYQHAISTPWLMFLTVSIKVPHIPICDIADIHRLLESL